MGGAVREVIAHQRSGDGAQRLLGRGDLRKNVRAVTVVLDHALKTANLAFNSAEPAQIRSLDLGIDTDGFAPWSAWLAGAGAFVDGAVSERAFLRGHIFLMRA